jgi:pyocin large subunit-like protein
MGRIKPTTKEKIMKTSEIQQQEVVPLIKLEINDTLQNSSPSLSHETQMKTEYFICALLHYREQNEQIKTTKKLSNIKTVYFTN